MAKKMKRTGGRSWKQERESVRTGKKSGSKSNKYRPDADTSQRPAAGSKSRYWRAGYTRKDGTRVKGHYVQTGR